MSRGIRWRAKGNIKCLSVQHLARSLTRASASALRRIQVAASFDHAVARSRLLQPQDGQSDRQADADFPRPWACEMMSASHLSAPVAGHFSGPGSLQNRAIVVQIIRIKIGQMRQTLIIMDCHPTVTKGRQPILPQLPQHPIDMNCRQTQRVCQHVL